MMLIFLVLMMMIIEVDGPQLSREFPLEPSFREFLDGIGEPSLGVFGQLDSPERASPDLYTHKFLSTSGFFLSERRGISVTDHV
jgi:hypothetical protein